MSLTFMIIAAIVISIGLGYTFNINIGFSLLPLAI